jgi:uncharacterized protein with PIN domain
MNIKLYLNENLSQRIAHNLRLRGYDVVSSHEVGMDGFDDEGQFEFAISQQRAVLTNNFSDFKALHQNVQKENRQHFGIIFTTQEQNSTIQQRLLMLLQSFNQNDLMNRLIWLNDFKFSPE